MTEVFVVESGEYSDRHIDGIFSTREKAHDFCALHNPRRENGERVENEQGYHYTPDYYVTAQELDPVLPSVPSDLFGFRVRMSKEGGAACATPISVMDVKNSIERDYALDFYGPGYLGQSYYNNVGTEIERAIMNTYGFMVLQVLARDEEHAIKIASEKRAELLALGRWPTKFDARGNQEKTDE